MLKIARLLVVVLILGSAACASGPQTVNVTLKTYGTTFSPESLRSGEVKFVVKNEATDLIHELIVVKTDLAADKLPLTAEGRVDEESTQMKEVGAAEDVDPGTSKDFTATLEAGRYVYFCNIDNHYDVGMRGEFTVSP